jgi:hypothetical protein
MYNKPTKRTDENINEQFKGKIISKIIVLTINVKFVNGAKK